MRFTFVVTAVFLFGRLLPLAAQDPQQVEALAPILMHEDRRDFDAAFYSRSLANPDSSVRQLAVLSLGRIGDRRATALLIPMLRDRDPVVVTTTLFALGLLRDSTAVEAITARLRANDSLSADAVSEAATALDRIGGSVAARFVGSALATTTEISRDRQSLFIPNALLDGWKLGALMPAQAMLRFADDTSADTRWRALYALGRRASPLAARALLGALRDATPVIRETATKALTRRYVDSTQLAAAAVKSELARALNDDAANVRIGAANALATYADSTTAGKLLTLLSDGDLNARVAGASALGEVKGSVAVKALDALLDRRDASWALRRAALMALVRADSATFARRAATWLGSADFRDRIAALQGWATLKPTDPTVFRNALSDADARVQAAALDAWSGLRGDSTVAGPARSRLASPVLGVRAAAATALRNRSRPADLDPLVAAWRASQADGNSDARLAVFNALHDLIRQHPELLGRLDDPDHRDFLARPNDPVLRAEAQRVWRDVADHWGPVGPIDTHKSLDDYRVVVTSLLLAPADPTVTIEVEGKGAITLQLLGHEAPLTVANFLRLVDKHYFDGNRWHRVVPGFVVQDGDPTGTGDGGPGWSIRDEINRERYVTPVAGMALSGPDTGGSQWFINLSAEPHLDGQYTIFGKVTGTYLALQRIVQGDVIRSIHR